jgi:hypothetical protein
MVKCHRCTPRGGVGGDVRGKAARNYPTGRYGSVQSWMPFSVAARNHPERRTTNPLRLSKSMVFGFQFQGRMAPRTPESGGLLGKYVTSNSTICPGCEGWWEAFSPGCLFSPLKRPKSLLTRVGNHSRMLEDPIYMWGCKYLYQDKVFQPRDWPIYG